MYAKLEKCPFFLNRVVGACGVFLNNQFLYEVHSSPGARGAGVPAVGLDSLSIAKKFQFHFDGVVSIFAVGPYELPQWECPLFMSSLSIQSSVLK